jgi:hypothetical protein
LKDREQEKASKRQKSVQSRLNRLRRISVPEEDLKEVVQNKSTETTEAGW